MQYGALAHRGRSLMSTIALFNLIFITSAVDCVFAMTCCLSSGTSGAVQSLTHILIASSKLAVAGNNDGPEDALVRCQD